MSQDTTIPVADMKSSADKEPLAHKEPLADKEPLDSPYQQANQLYPEDQERVDQYLKEGVNEIERSPFKPLRLMAWLTAVILLLGLLSRLIGYFIIPS